MVFWHPRGYAVYRVLEDYVRRKMRRAGYAEVRTPQLLPQEFWGRSGHWDKFGEHMFRVDDGELAMALKPMSCPRHGAVLSTRGCVRRGDLRSAMPSSAPATAIEPSGSTPRHHADARLRAGRRPCILPKQDVEGEVACFIALLGEVYETSVSPHSEVALATRPAVRAGDDATASGLVRGEARRCRAALRPRALESNPGEGAFYGPKLEFALRDKLGR